jgi:hypothetical protein
MLDSSWTSKCRLRTHISIHTDMQTCKQ